MDFYKSLFLAARANEMNGSFIANRTDHNLHLLVGGFGDVWFLLAFAYADYRTEMLSKWICVQVFTKIL